MSASFASPNRARAFVGCFCTIARIASNLDVLDFELTDDEMARIATLDRDERMGPHPDDMN